MLYPISPKSAGIIRDHSKSDQPFFIYFALPSPHTPIVPNQDFEHKSGVTAYGDYAMETDWAVGEVLHTLDSLKLSDNTLIFFSSDNGFAPYVLPQYNVEALGHFPSYIFRGYKSDIWEGGHRVPTIARWPGKVQPGSTCEDLISLTDFMATCADIFHYKLPENAAEDSYSILPDLLGNAKKPIRPAVVYQSIQGNFSIQEGKWKLEFCPGSGGWESPKNKEAYQQGLPIVQLYDMEADIGEKTNVQADHPKIVQQLTSLMDQYVREGRSTPGKSMENAVAVDVWKKQAYQSSDNQ